MEIIFYNGVNDLIVKFLDEYGVEVHTVYQAFKKGNVKNPYDRTVYGVGYIGTGRYSVFDSNCNWKQRYSAWRGLLGRCYPEKTRAMWKSYDDCEVCNEWLNYQNFAEWYDDNLYHVDNERMHVDKDILVPGNRIYSPDFCLIVPQRINMLFMERRNKSNGLPTGVGYSTSSYNPYNATYNGKYLGVFKTIDDAQEAYFKAKENCIKEIADEYKDKIPKKLYEALYNWKMSDK